MSDAVDGANSAGSSTEAPPSQVGHEDLMPAANRLRLTAAEGFWYLLMCISFGAGYLRKVPTKKALSDAGIAKMTGAESFWYLLMCISFGSGYFMKVPTKKALSDAGIAKMTGAESFWYLLMCISFGSGYFMKVPTKKALSELERVPTAVAPRH